MNKTDKLHISMSAPDIGEQEREIVNSVMQTPSLSFGPHLPAFEAAVAKASDCTHGCGVSSGTAGLHLGMIAAGAGQDDLVITTPFSFIASANCILYEKAVPLFVDVDENTGNIDPDQIAAAFDALQHGKSDFMPPSMRNGKSKEKKIKAILPVHAFGQPADMDPIVKLAHKHQLHVIEDACEALGAEYKGRKAGSLGDIAVFAFYPNKQITTGEGGMIVTDKRDWHLLFRSLRNQGRDEFNEWLSHNRLGYNYRMDELSAALGEVQIQRLDEILAKRRQVAEWYNQRLSQIENVKIPFIHKNTTRMSWFVYVIRILPPLQRDSVMQKLKEYDIPSRPYFTPIHLQPYYCDQFGYKEGDFPVTEKLGEQSLALPFSSVMSEEEVDYVCDRLQKTISTVHSPRIHAISREAVGK
jgi:dTDP-4-amino-4,6-dideoxygalactose transaminase